MDGLKVLRLDSIGFNARVSIDSAGNISHKIFHKFGIFLSALGDILFIDAL